MFWHTANRLVPFHSRLAGSLVVFLLLLVPEAWSGVDSVAEHYYPSVVRLEQTASGLRALLGRRFMKPGAQGFPIAKPILRYGPANGWEHEESSACGKDRDFACLPKKQEEQTAIPPITLPREEAVALRPSLQQAEQIEQQVYAWTRYGEFIWFGIGFYGGEGVSGVGGIGRYHPKTQQMEIRRPQALRDVSTSHLAHDGETLWLGTAGYYEGPDGYGHGLVQYDWSADRLTTFEGTDEGPCGFMVNDLLLEQNYLWVATDLGLSRWDRKSRTWAHYVPDPERSLPMRTVTCPELYASLLKVLPRSYQPSFDTIPYSELFQSIKHFRPRFLTSYVKVMPPVDWGCDELKFLAEGAQDFQALKTNLLSLRPISSPHFKCILEGFADKNSRDPEWRDLLLSSFEKPGEKGEYRDEVVLRLLSGFPGDTKVGEALVHRLKTAPNPWREAELLPTMLGEKSVPSLIEALDRFTDRERSGHILLAIVKALVQATHLSINPNGTVQPVPPNTDPSQHQVSEKALPHVTSRWKQWWEVHKAEYGAGPARSEPQQPDRGTVSTATRIEPTVLLSAPTSPLSIGTVCTLTASVKNIADPANPPLSNFPLSFHVTDGPHADIVKPFRGVTDANGTLTFRYSGTKSGIDKITVWHEGDDVFLDENYAEVAWGGPDLVVPLFVPPVLMSEGGKTFFATDWTQNTGSFPAAASTTRYFLSATNPVDPAKAQVVGERAVPALGPGERSEVKQLQFVLPSELHADTYYLAACADAAGAVLESDERNNCSFHKSPGHSSKVVPFRPSETPSP